MDTRQNNRTFLITVLVVAALVGGCESKQDRARSAFDQYQAAAAGGDLPGARRALLALVQADDSVPDYWMELGKLQLQLGEFGGAYDAFVHAHELDRANVQALEVLTQLTLRSGNLDMAESYAKQLELVAPENTAVRLTYGYVALRRADLDEAGRQADQLLAAVPYDSGGKILKARVLLESGKEEQAIVLLRDQANSQPSDRDTLRALSSMYELLERWPDVAWAARSLLQWEPKNLSVRAKLIEAELRSGRSNEAVPVTTEGLPDAPPQAIRALLAPWLFIGPKEKIADEVFKIGSNAAGDQRLALAQFLADAGRWPQVKELTSGMATLPVSAANIGANTLYGAALVQSGDRPGGLDRLNQALVIDGSNANSLRFRAEALRQAGDLVGAERDARKLVAVDRNVASSWLLLASIQRTRKQDDAVRRTLWDGFHAIPANQAIYQELRGLVVRTDGPLAGQRLTEEYRDQRNEQLNRSLV